jgi:hypothetical protein
MNNTLSIERLFVTYKINTRLLVSQKHLKKYIKRTFTPYPFLLIFS